MMKKIITSLLIMLTAVSGWAQESKASDEKPIAPVIVEGNVVRVVNAAIYAMQVLQSQMAGAAESAGIASEEDVNDILAQMRAGD